MIAAVNFVQFGFEYLNQSRVAVPPIECAAIRMAIVEPLAIYTVLKAHALSDTHLYLTTKEVPNVFESRGIEVLPIIAMPISRRILFHV